MEEKKEEVVVNDDKTNQRENVNKEKAITKVLDNNNAEQTIPTDISPTKQEGAPAPCNDFAKEVIMKTLDMTKDAYETTSQAYKMTLDELRRVREELVQDKGKNVLLKAKVEVSRLENEKLKIEQEKLKRENEQMQLKKTRLELERKQLEVRLETLKEPEKLIQKLEVDNDYLYGENKLLLERLTAGS